MHYRKSRIFQTIALALICGQIYLIVRNTKNTKGNEIQEIYTKDLSITEMNARVEKERKDIERQLAGMKRRKLPELILVGMFKGGTTTMSLWLTTHPQIIQLKTAGYYYQKYAIGHAAHMAQIPDVREDQIIYERCTVCYTSQAARERILAAYPQRNIKLLIMVRDPIARLISGYVQNVLQNDKVSIKETFEEYIFYPNGSIRTDTEHFQKSFYVSHLAKWLMIFLRENIHLVDADNFIKKPWIELEKIERLLKIKHLFSEDRFLPNPENPTFRCLSREDTKGMRCMGHAKGRTHPDISIETMQKLKRFFKPYNEQFFILADQRFSWSENYD